jgi:hypothetical protein
MVSVFDSVVGLTRKACFLLFELAKFQINRQHQESDQGDARSQANLPVLVFFPRLVNESVSALNGLFGRKRHLLESVSAE